MVLQFRSHHIRLVFVQVYLTAGAVYGLEGTLVDLEHCARSISSGTTDTELAFLEDQVATAAAQVQQSELQVCLTSLMLNLDHGLGKYVSGLSRCQTLRPGY